jgi:hypothetical protein
VANIYELASGSCSAPSATSVFSVVVAGGEGGHPSLCRLPDYCDPALTTFCMAASFFVITFNKAQVAFPATWLGSSR